MEKYLLCFGILLLGSLCRGESLDNYLAHIRREAAQCHQCNSVSSNDQCTGIQQCPGGDYGGCQTEVRTDGGGVMRITKKCKALEVCMSEEQQYMSQCTGHDKPQSICYYCCQDDLCNHHLPGDEPTTTTTTAGTSPPSSSPPGSTAGSTAVTTTTTAPTTTTTPPTTTTTTTQPPTTTTTTTTTTAPTTTTTPPTTTTTTTQPPTTTTTATTTATTAPASTGTPPATTTTTTQPPTTTTRPPCPDPCASEPCQNNGICLPDGEDFGCWCQAGYQGDLCEIPPELDTFDCDDRNPCAPENTAIYGYYYPHHDEEKYVQCDPYGGCYVMECQEGLVWSQEGLMCVYPTAAVRELERLLQVIDDITAST